MAGAGVRPLSVIQAVSCRGWSSDAWNALAVCRGLQELGHRVVLLCRRGRGEAIGEEARRQGVRMVEALEFANNFQPWSYWRDVRALRAICRREGADIIHVHRGVEHWLAALACLAGGPALVRSRHILRPVDRSPFNRWLYGRATDRVVAVSERVQQGYLADGFQHHSRLVVVPGGVDDRAFRPDLPGEGVRREFGVGAETPLVGVAGSLARAKGQSHLIRALGRLRARGFPAQLLVVGRGRDNAALRALAQESGLAPYIHFAGFREDLPLVLAACDLLVFPSVSSEGTSRTLFEYMSMGRPIVASRVGCVEEWVREEREGLLVPPGDEEALADAMERLLSRPEEARALGRAARGRAVVEFSIRVMAERLVSLYREVLAVRGARGARRLP
ncbi:MAG: glycosyltransferase family 4 protein [Nitrospinota bacterium]